MLIRTNRRIILKVLLIILLIFVVSFEGCINSENNNGDKNKGSLSSNTKEFNLKTYVVLQPTNPYPKSEVIVKFYVENDGDKEITIISPRDSISKMLSLDCGYVEQSYTMPIDLISMPLYVLEPGKSMVFVWKVKLDDTSKIKKSCKGVINFDYEDMSYITRYIKVVNAREYEYGNYKISDEKMGVEGGGNLKIKYYLAPQDIVVLDYNQKKQTPYEIKYEITNEGDGDVKILGYNVSHDENINLLYCSPSIKELSKEVLKPDERRILTCGIGFNKVPKIAEKYRVSFSVKYHVSFSKPFSFDLSSSVPTAEITAAGISFNNVCSNVKIPALGSAIILIKTNKKILSTICMLVSRAVVVYEANNILNYANNVYGYNDGVFIGKIYGKRYAKAFIKGVCEDRINDDNIKECVKKLVANPHDDDCLETLYDTIDEDKIKNFILKPRKNRAFVNMKRLIERSLRDNRDYVSGLSRDIVDKLLDEHPDLRRKLNSLSIGGIRISFNGEALLRDVISKRFTDLVIEGLEPNKEQIIQKYGEGFMRGFKVGFKKGLEKELPLDYRFSSCYGKEEFN